MPSQVSNQELGDAILKSVKEGTFPQSEDVASALVPPTALPKLLEVVDKSREDTRDEIRKISREASADVDGWISQARKLQDDIKRSQETAHEIVQQAEAGKEHTTHVHDATAKVSFLYSEIAYNENLSQVVRQLRDISTLLEAAQEAAVTGSIIHALEKIEEAGARSNELGPFENTRVVGVLKTKADQLKAAIIENVTESWHGLIVVDSADRRISLKETIQRESAVHINDILEAVEKLDLLDGFISRLSRDLDRVILSPRLVVGPDKVVSGFSIEGDDVHIEGHVTDMSVTATLEDIQALAQYISERLPPTVAVPLSQKFVPVVAKRLISNWLLPAVPLSTNGVLEFQDILSLVLGLAEYFDELEWTGQDRLRDWVDESAQLWLSKQKETSIVRIQAFLPKNVREKKTVERVETQVVSRGDAVLGKQEDQDEDWGAEWGDEEQQPVEENEEKPPPEVEEEDMSAWDDEDAAQEEPQTEEKTKTTNGPDEEDADAWGWGEEDETHIEPPQTAAKPKEQPKTNGQPPAESKAVAGKELTLRETYTVTAIPDSIMEIILQVVSEVAILNEPELVKSAIAPASSGLYSIPTLLLAMYRATALSHYSKDVAGNMLIYNDCTRISDRLRTFLREQDEKDKSSTLPQHLQPSVRLKLDNDIKAIEVFGKRAYGREMESQRTIIKDLLEGAQSFQSSTTAPFASECDNAIAMAIDRIEEVKRQWQGVLSHSALLQSLGSLVSTALTKFISDVEEMADIASDESKKLHSYCVSLSSLSSLFQTENEAGEPQDMTSVYTPNWFKFQYLGEILDSSLADIRYFWTDGELKLEMDAEEVVDLIKALFAESEHRRKAIGEIRRTSITR